MDDDKKKGNPHGQMDSTKPDLMKGDLSMESPRRGLQKFTKSQLANTLSKDVEDSLLAIINGNKLSIEDIWNLTDDQRKKIQAVLTAGFLTLVDEDREQFFENTEPMLSTKSRNE